LVSARAGAYAFACLTTNVHKIRIVRLCVLPVIYMYTVQGGSKSILLVKNAISRGSEATHLRCGRYDVTTSLLASVIVKEFSKSVNILRKLQTPV